MSYPPEILREYIARIAPKDSFGSAPAYPDNLGLRTKFGGKPDNLHEGQEPPECPCCTNPMQFVGQIDSFEHMWSKNPNAKEYDQQHFMFGDVGMIYVWFCFHCTWPHATMQTY